MLIKSKLLGKKFIINNINIKPRKILNTNFITKYIYKSITTFTFKTKNNLILYLRYKVIFH